MPFKWYAVKLVIICVIIFILQLIFPWITNEFALISKEVLFKPWMFLTSIFLHGGIEHLLYNMFALALFGSILEKIISEKRLLTVFFISGLLASFSALIYPASLGASGAIFGILGCLAILRPRMPVWFYGFPIPMFFAIFIWAAGDLLGLFYPSGIGNAAHLGGLAVGIIFGLKLKERFGEVPKRRLEEIPEKEFRKWEDEWL